MGSAWWRWPENKNTGRVAWFVVARRLLFYPLAMVALLVYVSAVFLGWGLRDARRAWKKMT